MPDKPLSRVALGGGFSLMGANLQVAANLNRHLNLRASGNYFTYSVNNISTNGFNMNANLNMAAAGASLDYYPFPKHGFRLSPGVLFYNQNRIAANGEVASGSSITLNDVDYYSDAVNAATGATPVTVAASLGLHTTRPAVTLTTGWGNMIPHKGGHWSFPFELGAALTGAPALNMSLTGWACTDEALTQCSDLAGSTAIAAEVQTNLNAQIAKWKNDLNPLKAYPIFSFGAAYSFHIRK